jgi:hypothetical protein
MLELNEIYESRPDHFRSVESGQAVEFPGRH